MLKELQPANPFEEIWAEGRLESAGKVLAALGRVLRPGSESQAVVHAILGMALEVTRAERIFLFDVAPAAKGELPVPGQCLASLNIDLEPVVDPLAKVPLPLLKEVLAAGRPLVAMDAEADPRRPLGAQATGARPRALGVVPLGFRGSIVGLLYFDHRFHTLDLPREAGLELAGLCHLLAVHHNTERLVGENHCLWQDIARLKERAATPAVSAPAAAAESRPRANRSRLRGDYSLIVGSSGPMLEIFQLLDRVAGSTATVHINGESGTGKELIANAVHRNSPRAGKPFVSENCGALTETLLESELFGYVKGAFTGATKDSKGLFEMADSGTLFLDEVGDMSPSMQKKLLRVLQEGMIRRVGGKDFIHVDVRLITATNKDLMEECRHGRFREDLYYRLNVINIKVPALRDRKEDIPELVEHFLGDMTRQGGRRKTIEPGAVKKLLQYSWPGNIRELQNEVKRFHALSEDVVRVTDLSEAILQGDGRDLLQGGLERELFDLPLREATEKLERELIRRALVTTKGNKSLVAKKLQIPKTSLYNKINKYHLDAELL